MDESILKRIQELEKERDTLLTETPIEILKYDKNGHPQSR